jgi:hypothetical protein
LWRVSSILASSRAFRSAEAFFSSASSAPEIDAGYGPEHVVDRQSWRFEDAHGWNHADAGREILHGPVGARDRADRDVLTERAYL